MLRRRRFAVARRIDGSNRHRVTTVAEGRRRPWRRALGKRFAIDAALKAHVRLVGGEADLQRRLGRQERKAAHQRRRGRRRVDGPAKRCRVARLGRGPYRKRVRTFGELTEAEIEKINDIMAKPTGKL